MMNLNPNIVHSRETKELNWPCALFVKYCVLFPHCQSQQHLPRRVSVSWSTSWKRDVLPWNSSQLSELSQKNNSLCEGFSQYSKHIRLIKKKFFFHCVEARQISQMSQSSEFDVYILLIEDLYAAISIIPNAHRRILKENSTLIKTPINNRNVKQWAEELPEGNKIIYKHQSSTGWMWRMSK